MDLLIVLKLFHFTEDNVVDLPSLRIIKQSSISGPVMMEALVIDVPIGFCQQHTVSDTEFDGVSLTEDITLENNDKSDSICENSLEYFSDHLSSSNSKRDIFFSASETTPKNSSKIPKSDDDDHLSFQTPKLFMSDSDDQILTQLNMDEQRKPQTSRNIIGSLARTESNNTEEEVSETLADIENEMPLSHNYCAAEILTQSDEDGLYSTVLNKIRNKGVAFVPLSSEEDDVLKNICRPNVDEFLKYMKIILEGTMVKMHTHESYNFSGTPTELERSIQALHSLAWKFVEETEKNHVSELDKNTTTNVSSLMTAINASLLALEQIDDPFGVSDNILNEIQSSVCFDLETLNNKDLTASEILDLLSEQLKNFTEVVNRQVARVTEQRVIAVLRNTIGTTLVYIRQLQQNCSKIKCIDVNSLTHLFFMIQPLETILNEIAAIEEADESKSSLKLKQLLIPPISSIAFSLDNLNTAFKSENSDNDQDLKDIFDRISDSTIQFMALASQGTESNNIAECFICFTKPINDLCCHLRRLSRSTENIVSSDYGSDDKLLMDFETLFDELMMDIDTLINNVNVVRDSENNINPLSTLLEPLQDMKIGLFQINQVLLSNQSGSNMSFEVMSCFEHLSQQLVQLNNCIINQSIVEETNKEMPFESSIKMMQNILFDDAIDDLGVNGILFGSVMKPLLQLQSTIVSKMASVESDLSFSEHTDGGACDTKSLSLSLSNNAQTVLDKAENDNLKRNDDETSSLNNLVEKSDEDNNLLQASTSKVNKELSLLENNLKNDLVLKRGFECDIGETFKDEEPNILTSEDDRENSGFEILFDETDLETISDIVEDDYLGNVVQSKTDDKSLEILTNEENINTIGKENYDVIPKHALESFDQNIHQDSMSNLSTDLFDELKETLKELSEETQNEVNVSDDPISKTNKLKESSPEHLNKFVDKTNDTSVDAFDNMDELTSQQSEEEIKKCHSEMSEEVSERIINHNHEIISTIDQVKKSNEREIEICENVLGMSQTEVFKIVNDEVDTTECVDSDKSISNNTVLTNSGISDQLELQTNGTNNKTNLETNTNINEPLNALEGGNISKQVDNNESSNNFVKLNEMAIINNNLLDTMDIIKNPDVVTQLSVECINSELGILENVDSTELIENMNNLPNEVCLQDHKSLETQILECADFSNESKIDENLKAQSNDVIVDTKSVKKERDCNLNANNGFIDTENQESVILHANTTQIDDSEELSLVENHPQKSYVQGQVTIEEIDPIKITEIETMYQPSQISNEHQENAEINNQQVLSDECYDGAELNKTSVTLVKNTIDIEKEKYEQTGEGIATIEEIPNEIKECILHKVGSNNSDLQNKNLDTVKEIVEQTEELTLVKDINIKTIPEDKIIEVVEKDSSNKNNIILAKNINETCNEVEINEKVKEDEISQDVTNEMSNSEIINLQCHSFDTDVNTVHSPTKIHVSQTENNDSCINFEDVVNDKQNVKDNLSKDVEQNSDNIQQSGIHNLNEGSTVKTVEDLSNPSRISSAKIVECDTINTMPMQNNIEEDLTNSKSDIEECNLKSLKTIENDSIITHVHESHNSKVSSKIVDSEELSEKLDKKDDDFNENNSRTNATNNLWSTEENENKFENPNGNVIKNEDNNIEEKIAIKSEYNQDVKLGILSDSTVISNETHLNEKSIESTKTSETENEEKCLTKLNKFVKDVNQATIIENNVTNDEICEVLPTIQNKNRKVENAPLLIAEENNALINNEVITAECTQLIDTCRLDENEVEIKYESDKKGKATYEQKTILDNEGSNKGNLVDTESKEKLIYSVLKIINDNEEQASEEIRDKEKEFTSAVLLTEQNTSLICEEIISAESVQLLETKNHSIKNVDEKYEKEHQSILEGQQITVLENMIDSQEIIKEPKDTTIYEKKSNNELSSPENVDMSNITDDKNKTEECSSILNERNEIQNLKSNNENSDLVSSEIIDNCEIIKAGNNITCPNVDENVLSKSEQSIESGIEVSLTEDDFDKSLTELETTKTNTEKEIDVGKTCSSEMNYLPNENNSLTKEIDCITNDTTEQKCLLLVEESMELNNTEIVTIESAEDMSRPNVCLENSKENYKSQFKQVAECQNVVILENVKELETDLLAENSKSIVSNSNETNTTEDNFKCNETSEFNITNNKPIKLQSQVSIEECKALVNEVVIVTDSTQSLKLLDTEFEKVNENLTEHLVDSVEITEPKILKPSIDNNINIETLDGNAIDTGKNKDNLTESKNKEKNSKIESVIDEISQNTTDKDKNTKNQENNNIKKFIDAENHLAETTEIKSLIISKDAENKTIENENKIESETVSNKSIESSEVLSENTARRKQTIDDNLNLANESENNVISLVEINEEEKYSKTENSKEILNNKHGLKAENKMESKVLLEEKIANWQNDIIPEGEIIDLSLNETVNTSSVKPKLHCVEHLAAFQTKCVMLENVNTLKLCEKNSMENAQIEHELSIAAIGNLVLDYDSVNETESSKGSQKNNLENATLSYVENHSNEIEVKNVNVFKAPNEEKTTNDENILNNAMENSTLKIENKDSKCTTNLNEQINVPDKLNKLETQTQNEPMDELLKKLNNETNIQEVLKTKHEEVDELQQSTLKKVNEPLGQTKKPTESAHEKNKEPVLNEIKNDTLCENNAITRNQVIDSTKEKDSLEENKSDKNKIVENVTELKKQTTVISPSEIESIDDPLNIDGTLRNKDTEEIAGKLYTRLNKTDVVKGLEETTVKEQNQELSDEIKTNLCENDKVNIMEETIKNTDKKNSTKKKLSPKSKKSSSPDSTKNNNDKKKINNEKMEIENLNKSCNENAETKKESNDKLSEKLNDGTINQVILTNQEVIDELQLSLNESVESKDILTDTFSEKINVETISQDNLILNKQHDVIAEPQQSLNSGNKIVEPSKTSSDTTKTNIKDQTLDEIKNETLCEKIRSKDDINEDVNDKSTSKSTKDIKTDKNIEITDEVIEDTNKKILDDNDNTEQLKIKLKPEIEENNDLNTLEELQNKNDKCTVEEITKNISNDNQTEKQKNNELEVEKTKVTKDETEKDKKKRGSKKKKTNTEPQGKKSPSPEKLTQETNNDHNCNQQNEETFKTNVDTLEDKTISNTKLSGKLDKELQEEIKDNQNIKQNASIIKTEEVEPMLDDCKINTPIIDKIETLEKKDDSKISDKQKSVVEESKKEKRSVKQKSRSRLQDNSLSPEKSIKVDHKVDHNQKCNDELKEQLKVVSQVEDILENNTIQNLDNDNSKKQRDLKPKKISENQVQSNIVKENKQITNDRKIHDACEKVLENSSVDMNTLDTFDDEFQKPSRKQYVPYKDDNQKIDLSKNSSTKEERDTKQTMINRKNNEKVNDNEQKTLVSTTYEVTEYDDIVERKKCGWTSEREISSTNFVKTKSPERNWNENDNNSLRSQKFERNQRTLLSANLSEENKYGYDIRKSPSKRYLDVSDAYQSQTKPLTYRSMTPESRLSSESLRYSSDRDTGRFYGNREVSRFLSSRSSSLCPESSKRSIDSYLARSRSPAFMPYRCPSETAIKYYRSEDDSNMLYSRRRRGSDSFLHDSAARDSSYYSSWRLSERYTPSRTYSEDMNRTKVV